VTPIFSHLTNWLGQLVTSFISKEISANECEFKLNRDNMEHECKYMWIIDNGHGEDTLGKRSPLFEDGTQLLEFEFNRRISEKLMEYLSSAGVRYHNLVPEIEGDVTLSERVSRANDLESDIPLILVSIHGNAFGAQWTSPAGIETYHYCKSKKGESIADVFQNRLTMTTGWKDRGVKTANFYILKHTNMPAILTENGFFTNKQECKKMLSDDWVEKLARAHFDAIMEIEREGL